MHLFGVGAGRNGALEAAVAFVGSGDLRGLLDSGAIFRGCFASGEACIKSIWGFTIPLKSHGEKRRYLARRKFGYTSEMVQDLRFPTPCLSIGSLLKCKSRVSRRRLFPTMQNNKHVHIVHTLLYKHV